MSDTDLTLQQSSTTMIEEIGLKSRQVDSVDSDLHIDKEKDGKVTPTNPDLDSLKAKTPGKKRSQGKIMGLAGGLSLGAISSAVVCFCAPGALVWLTALLGIPFVTPAVIAVVIIATAVLMGLIGLSCGASVDIWKSSKTTPALSNKNIQNRAKVVIIDTMLKQVKDLKTSIESLKEKIAASENKVREILDDNDNPNKCTKNDLEGMVNKIELLNEELKNLQNSPEKNMEEMFGLIGRLNVLYSELIKLLSVEKNSAETSINDEGETGSKMMVLESMSSQLDELKEQLDEKLKEVKKVNEKVEEEVVNEKGEENQNEKVNEEEDRTEKNRSENNPS
ncbi:MAG: hypothetical protein LBG86_00745 [Puniceicoccales bacterium]|jgi:hypothetical protein|nr:hypothetical protein [Puniceicoccales bacterium]